MLVGAVQSRSAALRPEEGRLVKTPGTVARPWVAIVAALAVGVLLAVGAATAAAAPPPSTYVSLGGSLAFGHQPDLVAAGDTNPADYTGYAEDYASMHPGMTLANFGCPSTSPTQARSSPPRPRI